MNGLKLKGKRAERGITQDELARITGITVVSYSRKENGKREFSCSEISKIINALGLSTSEVMSIFFE